jgi:hypothetical protein
MTKTRNLARKPRERKVTSLRHKIGMAIVGLLATAAVLYWLWIIVTVTSHYTPPPL